MTSNPTNTENPRVRISAFFAKSLIWIDHFGRGRQPCCRIKPRTLGKALYWVTGSGACNPLRFRRYKGPGGWRWTSHSPTGSGPEGSSPNELRFGSLVNLLLISSVERRMG